MRGLNLGFEREVSRSWPRDHTWRSWFWTRVFCEGLDNKTAWTTKLGKVSHLTPFAVYL